MEKQAIKKILEEHQKYLNGEDGGERANLCGMRLTGVDLSHANLKGARMRRANLEGANLHQANLAGADLRGAHLSGTQLDQADLSGADLRYAELRAAILIRTDLTNAKLKHADLGLYGIDEVYIEETIMPDGKVFDRAIHNLADLI